MLSQTAEIYVLKEDATKKEAARADLEIQLDQHRKSTNAKRLDYELLQKTASEERNVLKKKIEQQQKTLSQTT